MRSWIRACAAEPAVADPPARVPLDWVLVAVASATAVAEVIFRTDVRWPIPALIVCLSTIPVLLVRRTRPLFAVAVGCGAVMAFNLLVWLATGDPGGLATGSILLICIYSVYRWGSGRDGLIGAGIVAGTAVIGNLTDAESVGDVIGGLVVLALPILLGLLERSRTVSAARRLDAARARERERLARDLHDTVAHHVSAIAIQAQAGRAVWATRPDAALAALEVIEREASRTLAEMRAIVGALRAGDEVELAPQPGIADLVHLGAGQPVQVEITVDPDLGPLTPVVDAAAYRIAQEALTNAVRHGDRVRTVSVTVRREGERLQIVVDDDGHSAVAATARTSASGGYGLAGMAERAALVGGHLQAGPAPAGRGWRVAADLPIDGGVSS